MENPEKSTTTPLVLLLVVLKVKSRVKANAVPLA
jgi:hypothetical protein